MFDIVTTGGYAYEYHEGSGWTYLTAGASAAKSGQGVSCVLLNDGTLWEFSDSKRTWSYLDSNVASFDVGTDRVGVNMVEEFTAYGTPWEHSDSGGWRYLGSGIKSVSAGQQGISGL